MTLPTGPSPIIDSADIPRASSARSVEKREVADDSPYKTMLDDIVSSPRHYNEKQLQSWVLPAKMDELLAQIEADTKAVQYTKKERVAGSNLISESPLSFEDLLLEQIDYAISDSDPLNTDPVEEKWDTHMTRQNGLRNTVATLLESEKFRGPFIEAVRKRQADIIRARDGVESESHFTPEQFQKVAEDEGRVAVESTPVVIDMGDVAQAARAMVTEERQVAAPERHPKLARVFAPYKEPVLPPSSVSQDEMYAAMVNGDDEAYARVQEIRRREEEANAPLRKEKADYNRLVNEESLGYSLMTLENSLRLDNELKAILTKAGYETVNESMVTALREDEDLRYKVGEYFLDKLNVMVRINPEDFGPRVEANAQKRGDYVDIPGMPTTTSREYAAWLALTKVSGMFNYKAERESDGERYDERTGRLNNAQHRNAADQVLGSGPARFY